MDRIACKEAKAFKKRVVLLMASKHDEYYGKMVGFVRAWMSLSVIHSKNLMLPGARFERAFRPEIMDGAVFSAMEGKVQEW